MDCFRSVTLVFYEQRKIVIQSNLSGIMLNPTVNRSSALNNGYEVVLQSQEFHLKPFIFSPFAPELPVTRHLCRSTSLVLLIVMSSVLTFASNL